jgi:hypothetical protein
VAPVSEEGSRELAVPESRKVAPARRPDESAWRSARREFPRTIESWKFVLLTIPLDIVCALTAALIARSHSSNESVVLLSALIGTVGGVVLALAAVGLVHLLRAPYLQRDEARSERDAAHAEIARLTAPRAFPDVAIDLPSVSQEPREYGTHIEIPVVGTNRDDERVSLEFRLVVPDPISRSSTKVECFRTAEPSNRELCPPLSIAPKDSGDAVLHFPIVAEQVKRLRRTTDTSGMHPAAIPFANVYVEIYDRVSDTYRKHYFGYDRTAPPP